jgi:hypothetical protein
VGKRYWAPRQSGRQFTEWGRHSGSTHVRNKILRDDSAADQRYTGTASQGIIVDRGCECQRLFMRGERLMSLCKASGDSRRGLSAG